MLTIALAAVLLFGVAFIFRRSGAKRRDKVEEAAKRAVERRMRVGGGSEHGE